MVKELADYRLLTDKFQVTKNKKSVVRTRKSGKSDDPTSRRDLAPVWGSTLLQNSRFRTVRTFGGAISVASGTAAPFMTASQFSLSQLPTFTDFTNLFDQYRINRITMRFFQPYQQTGTFPLYSAASQTNLPKLFLGTAIDYDDSNVPSSMDELRAYQSFRYREITNSDFRSGEVTIRPCISTEIYRTSVTTAYEPRSGVWLDTAYPDVPHYAIKWGCDVMYADGPNPITVGVAFTIPVEITYDLEFRLVL